MSEEYFVLIANEKFGPLERVQVRKMLESAQITLDTMFCTASDLSWKALSTIFKKPQDYPPPPTIQASNVIIAGAAPQNDFLPSGSDAIFVLGLILVICGMIVGGFVYGMEVSVPGDTGRIVNLGLIADRIIMGLGAMCTILFGGLLFCCSAVMALSERFKSINR